MNGHQNGTQPDPIDQAVEATQQVLMLTIPVTIASTGRPAQLAIPRDITEAELFELVGWMSTAVRNSVIAEAQKRKGPQLVVAHGSLPPS